MSRQPIPGAGAAVRTPSGAAAPAPSPSPLPPQRYRALRARYNALLVTLYERTSLTLREIAAAAGRTDRAVQMLVRALGCRPRNAKTCRPGTNVGVRRAGEKPPPLNAPATRRVAAAFAGVARELAGSADARAASELQRATVRARQRTARTQARVIAGAARELTHLAAAMEDTAATRHALADGPKHSLARKAGRAGVAKPGPSKWPSREDMRLVQERARLAAQARMYDARRARELAAGRANAAPAPDPGIDGRSDRGAERAAAERASAERTSAERTSAERPCAEPRPGPRIRSLW